MCFTVFAQITGFGLQNDRFKEANYGTVLSDYYQPRAQAVFTECSF